MADALYNIVRPLKFGDVKGQVSTVKAVQNGIANKSLEHVLCFFGQTGGGKTTLARIVARALNCENPDSNGEPCCECSACKGIINENSPDYYELNAALNGGKADIDSLVSNVSYMPSVNRTKVFVIDEAQRLSSDAWAALLKTLEEPPAHVYFIICTTEFEVIPDAIKNRCGKYSFKAISVEDITEYLVSLNTKFNHNYERKALELIAESSDGSLRDAVNNYSHILIPFEDKESITADDVRLQLNLVSSSTICDFVTSLCNNDLTSALYILTNLEENAVEASAFIKNTLKICADLITVISLSKPSIGWSEDYHNYLSDVVALLSLTSLVEVSDKLNTLNSSVSNRNFNQLRLLASTICVLKRTASEYGTVQDNSAFVKLVNRVTELEMQVEKLKGGCTDSVASESIVSRVVEPAVVEKDSLTDDFEQFANTEPLDILDTVDNGPCEEDNPFFAMFGFTDEEPSSNNDMFSDQEYISSPNTDLPTGSQDIVENPVEKLDEEPIIEDTTNAPLSFNLSSCNIKFSSDSLASAFAESSKEGNLAEKKLNSIISSTQPILGVLVDELCEKKVTDKEVTLATPFAPVEQIVTKYINHYSISNVNVVGVDGLKLD